MIEVQGVDELRRRLGRAMARAVLRRPMARGLARLEAGMSLYPAQPETNYVRTGTLGRRWTQSMSERDDGLEGVVGNNTDYAPFVQSEEFQAGWMGHWQTDADVVELNRTAIERDFQAAIDGALE